MYRALWRKRKKLKGLNSIIHSTSSQYANSLPETLSPLLEKLLSDSAFTHVISTTSLSGKSLLPRVAARLDAPTLSDITSLEHDSASNSTTLTRPIYAGNAIATVRGPSSIPIKFFTVRSTAFSPAESTAEDGNAAVQTLEPVEVANLSTEHSKMQKSSLRYSIP